MSDCQLQRPHFQSGKDVGSGELICITIGIQNPAHEGVFFLLASLNLEYYCIQKEGLINDYFLIFDYRIHL